MASEKSSDAVLQVQVTSLDLAIPIRRRIFFMAQLALRMAVIVFTSVAISVTVTNAQSVVVFGFKFEAHFTYSTAFKFLVAADAVVCGFSALSSIFIYFFLCRSASQLKNYFFLFLHDTVMMVLIISGCAAATAIGYVGRYGEKHMTWQPTCGYVSKFCHKMSISLGFSYLSFFAYLVLTVMSAHSLMPRPIQ